MSRWRITISVSEEDLRTSAAESASEEELEEMGIETMIWQEMGWVGQSGIHIEDIEQIIQP